MDRKEQGPAKGRSLEERLGRAGARVEDEVRRLVRRIDDEVVPEVRRDGTAALRSVAEQFERLARYMDDNRNKPRQP